MKGPSKLLSLKAADGKAYKVVTYTMFYRGNSSEVQTGLMEGETRYELENGKALFLDEENKTLSEPLSGLLLYLS